MKLVINTCFGGFSLSEEAYKELGIEWDGYGYDYNNEEYRNDPRLVEVVEKLGEKANGRFSELKVIEIPFDIDYYIDEYDGMETVYEKPTRGPWS
jgi:hypothetical protein